MQITYWHHSIGEKVFVLLVPNSMKVFLHSTVVVIEYNSGKLFFCNKDVL